ncbi:MAG: colicin E3-like toxin immunity protein [Gammaproteobacteria bacterium]|nr:colicin E3-like toxin immunity protein [Gammaproteobacteria bacterium]MCW8909461.1 colicin E3-like toxin immunity protein [Gammaproteobacteria bacterium]MCW9005653.1 colicin E3-like toxin immunity protein [Gammaproteobacteria bacterium]MCW9055028.1 colicin E3-like toxin immunity protein [Gammaproteobacteria bacterium]
MSKNADIALKLNWYENEGNNLIGEEAIANMSVDQMLELFDAPFWNQLYHCWEAQSKELKVIQPNVDHHINTRKYSYFIEIYKIQHNQSQ